MDINPKPIIIAYAGSLKGGTTTLSHTLFSIVLDYFWTYNPKNIEPSTRTGSYLLKAISILRDKHDVPKEKLQVWFWGDIDNQNQIEIDELNLSDYTRITGFKSKVETKRLLAEANLLFLPLEKGIGDQPPLFLPGKLFEYLSLNKPILALSENGECNEILEKSGLGIIAPPDDPEAIAGILYDYIEHRNKFKKLQGNKSFIEQYSFEKKTQELASVFDKLLANNN